MRFTLPIYILAWSSMMLSSCRHITELIPTDVDQYLGSTYAAQLQSEVQGDPILDSITYHVAYAHLYEMASKITASPQIKFKGIFPYQIKIVQNDSIINAFCIPGGYIYVYTGLIHFLENEAELAGVLAHEIAHAECRHSVYQMVSSQLIRFGIMMVLGADPGFLIGLMENLLHLSFSREDETEADTFAVYYINTTPYHPLGIQGFFKKMKQKDKEATIAAFLSTHPASDDRDAHIETIWKQTGSKTGILGKDKYAILKQSLSKK